MYESYILLRAWLRGQKKIVAETLSVATKVITFVAILFLRYWKQGFFLDIKKYGRLQILCPH